MRIAHQQLVRRRLGWDGDRIPTLEELGTDTSLSGLEIPVTRERIRQLQVKAERAIKKHINLGLRPPALVRAIELLEKNCPISEAGILTVLKTVGLMKVNLTYDTLYKAAELVDCDWPLAPLGVYDEGERIIFSVRDPEGRRIAKDLVERIVRVIRSRSFLRAKEIEESMPDYSVEHESLLDNVVTHFPCYQWLNREERIFWRVPTDPLGQGNRVLRICRRLFSIADSLSLSDICVGIARALRHGLSVKSAALNAPSEAVLGEMLVQTKSFEVKDGWVTRAAGVEFRELRAKDKQIILAAKGLGRLVNFSDICHNAVKEGMSLQSAQVLVTTYSPFLLPVKRGFYRVLVDPDTMEPTRLSDSVTQLHQGCDDEGNPQEQVFEEVLFQVDARALLSGKAILSDTAPKDQYWEVWEDSGSQLGRCKIQGKRVSEIKRILEKLGATSGDLIRLNLNQKEERAYIHLMSDER